MNKSRASVISHAVKKELSMPRSLKSTLIAMIMGFIALAAMTNNVSACSINPNYQPPPKSELVDAADIVVIGQAIGGGGNGSLLNPGATILVEKYLKGNGPDILFAKGHRIDSGACITIAGLWSREIFYYRSDEMAADPTSAWQDWDYAGRDTADSATIAEIVAYTGQSADPIPSPLNIRVAAFLLFFNSFEVGFISMYCQFPLGILLAIFLVRRVILRRRRLKLAMQV